MISSSRTRVWRPSHVAKLARRPSQEGILGRDGEQNKEYNTLNKLLNKVCTLAPRCDDVEGKWVRAQQLSGLTLSDPSTSLSLFPTTHSHSPTRTPHSTTTQPTHTQSVYRSPTSPCHTRETDSEVPPSLSYAPRLRWQLEVPPSRREVKQEKLPSRRERRHL